MSDRYFVDTNILMYAHDAAAGEKHARAKALVAEILYSEDLLDGQRYGTVRVKNPLTGAE